ncbi:MAG: BrnT family toxin [Alphaproteobacteria bacterium]|nr:BrnT family toxin [Alphaproteobacteria bacterium]
MEWTWDPRKNAANLRKHGVGFDVAQFVFADPLHRSRPDVHPDAERWQSIGMINGVCLFVVHTLPERAGSSEIGRIISARKATPRERGAYEKGSF